MSARLRKWYFIVTFTVFPDPENTKYVVITIALNNSKNSAPCAYAEVANQVVSYARKKYPFSILKINRIDLDRTEVIE